MVKSKCRLRPWHALSLNSSLAILDLDVLGACCSSYDGLAVVDVFVQRVCELVSQKSSLRSFGCASAMTAPRVGCVAT